MKFNRKTGNYVSSQMYQIQAAIYIQLTEGTERNMVERESRSVDQSDLCLEQMSELTDARQ